MVRALKRTIWLILLLSLSACRAAQPAAPATLTVMATASLTEAFQELGQQFEAAHPGVKVQFNFAGSQQLAQQIVNGAPADVFASASQKTMDLAVQARRVDLSQSVIFLFNRLVVILPKSNPGGLAGLPDLARPGLKLVLAAKEVPVGQYALEFLDKAAQDPSFSPAYKQDVLKNVVSYEENVKSVLAKVRLGEADAGIVYTSDASNGAGVDQIVIPDGLNVMAGYPIAPLMDSPHAVLAQGFIDLVLSDRGQAVLAKYGFIPVVR